MEFVVLGLLMIQDMTIYQLNASFRSGIALFYSASYGSLRAALDRLSGAGKITMVEKVENGRNKKIYAVADSGRAAFFEWMAAHPDPAKLEVQALSRLFFLGHLEPAQRRQVLTQLLAAVEESRAALEVLDQAVSTAAIDERFAKHSEYQRATLAYGLASHEVAQGFFARLLEKENDK